MRVHEGKLKRLKRLCANCAGLYDYDHEPEWQPNHRRRIELLTERLFHREIAADLRTPREVTKRIASYCVKAVSKRP